MKKIFNFMLRDLVSAKRDYVILYMLLAPLLIAFIMGLVIPSFESSPVTFAVDNNLDSGFKERLGDYGKILSYENRRDLIARVGRNDNVIGLTMENNNYLVILEGNEGKEVEEAAFVVIDNTNRDADIATYKITNLGDTRSLIKEYSMILIILMIILMAGMVTGFNIIDEKESGAIRAIATTPLRLWEFLAARGLLVLIFSIVISLLSTLILIGTGVDYLKVTLGAIFCSGIGILLGVLIGGVSDNQIKGIAIMKILIFPYTFIPVASIFVPERWQAFLYIFPNYWMFRILRNVFVDMNNPDFWFSGIITLAITAVLTVLFILTFRKRLKLK